MMSRGYRIESEGSGLARFGAEVPQPGRGQVLVRNLATAVNFHDLLNIQGVLPNLAVPRVPFSDNCGEIVALGAGVANWQVGDRVMAAFFPFWLAGQPTTARCAVCYGDQINGFLQTYTVVEAASLVLTPDTLSDIEAATLTCAGATAWRSLVEEAAIKPGQTVLIQGTGGVALFALQIAKLCGARVILISSSDEKLAFGAKLGADHLINYRDTPAWDAAAIDLTGGKGVDVVIEIGGADTFARSLNTVKTGGHIAIIGVRSGMGKAAPFVAEQVLIKNVTIKGVTVGSVQTLADVAAAYAVSGLRPVIDQSFALDDAQSAMDLMIAQQHIGKIGIRISE